MAYIILPSRWRVQPRYEVELDLTHPLCAQISGYFPLWLANRNLVNKKFGTRTGTTLRARERLSRGFGSTVGAGTTDLVNTGFTAHSTLRTYVASAMRLGDGANGRIFDKVDGANSTVDILYWDSGGLRLYYQRMGSGGTQSTQYNDSSGWIGTWTQIGAVMDTTSAPPVAPTLYWNGKAASQTTIDAASGSWNTNNSPYCIGNRATDNGRNWDGFIEYLLIADRLWSAAEFAAFYENPYQILKPLQRRIYFKTAAGGDISAALSGSSATFSLGSFTVVHENVLSGQSSTLSTGTIVPTPQIPLSGQFLSPSQGTLGITRENALTGQNTTVSQGTIVSTPQIPVSGQGLTSNQGSLGVTRENPLSGQGTTLSQGTVVSSLAVPISGQALTISQGTISPTIEIPLTGQSVTISLGTLTPVGGDSNNVSVALNGESLTSAQGTLSVTLAVPLTGTGLTGSQGSLSSALSVGISGLSATVSQGTLSLTISPELAGQVVTVSQGTLSPEMAISLSGQTLTFSLGTITPSVPGLSTVTRILWG